VVSQGGGRGERGVNECYLTEWKEGVGRKKRSCKECFNFRGGRKGGG